MKNLWISLIPFLLICFCLVVWMIVATIKRHKDYLFLDIFCGILVIGSLVGCIPYFKDITQNKLESFTGIYKEYMKTGSSNTLPGCSKNIFIDENGIEEYLVVPSLVFAKYELEKGKRYHITYYKNSHVVYDVQVCN